VGEIRRRKSSTWPSNRPARSRSARGGRFACQPVWGRPARRPRRSRRAGRRGPPARPPVPRRIMPTSSAFTSAMPTVRATEDGRAREPGGGGFGSGAARIQYRVFDAAAGGRSRSGGRRSVIGVERFLRPRPRRCRPAFAIRHLRLCHSAASMGVDRGGARRPCGRGSVVSPQPELVARSQAVTDRAAKSSGRSRSSPGPSSEPRSRSCHQLWEPLPRSGDRLGHSIGL
jgi:hypothetical protein